MPNMSIGVGYADGTRGWEEKWEEIFRHDLPLISWSCVILHTETDKNAPSRGEKGTTNALEEVDDVNKEEII